MVEEKNECRYVQAHTAWKNDETEKLETLITNLSSLGPYCLGFYDLMPSFN